MSLATLLAEDPIDPWNANRTFLRLHHNVVALLKPIEVILVDGNVLKAAPVSPGCDDERLCGNAPVATFPTTVAGIRTGREVSILPFRKRSPAKIQGTGIIPK